MNTMTKTYWVIENLLNGQIIYWTGGIPHLSIEQSERNVTMWTNNIHEALKMSSKQEAEYQNKMFEVRGEVCEHMDIELPSNLIPDAKGGGHTMTTQEALEVLKDNLDMYHPDNTTAKALTIAIECMENNYRASELILEKIEQFPEDMGLYTRGLYDGYYNSVNIINSLTKTESR